MRNRIALTVRLFALAAAFCIAGTAWGATEKVGGYTWTYRINGDTAEIYGTYNGYPSYDYTPAISPSPTGTVTIPSTLGGKPVTSIGQYAFRDCSGLTSVTIPDSVTSIGDSAFYGCSSLTTVTIPDSVTNIGSYAFRGCSGLTEINIPDSIANMGGYVFSDCSGLRHVTIGGGISSIPYSLFYSCGNIRDVSIPQCVLSGGLDSIFPSTYSIITNVVVLSGVNEIGSEAFSVMRGMEHVTLPATVTNIHAKAFFGCENLHEVTLDGSVNEIDAMAFFKCINLVRLAFSSDVTVEELPKPNGCTLRFAGWSSDIDDGEMLLQGDAVKAGDVYYARWEEKNDGVIASFDLAIPDEITVGDYGCGLIADWSTSLISEVYDDEGVVINSDSIYVSNVSRNYGSDYYYHGENYLSAGVYTITIESTDPRYTGSATQTITVNKTSYSRPDYISVYSRSDESYIGSGSYINMGTMSDGKEFVIRSEGYYYANYEFPNIWDCNIWVSSNGDCSRNCCDGSHYTLSYNAYGEYTLQFNAPGNYHVEVTTMGSYGWEDEFAYYNISGGCTDFYVYVEPSPISKLTVSAESDLVYTGDPIINTQNGADVVGGFELFDGRVRLHLSDETSLYFDSPVAVTNAGTYAIALGAARYEWEDYARPPDGDLPYNYNWLLYVPNVDHECRAVKYTGLMQVSYTVAPRPVTAEQMELILPASLVYDCVEKVCSIIITNDYNGVVLQEGVDYDVGYANNVDAGTATVTITCKGNYTGTFSRTFEIVNADFGLVVDGESGGASGESGAIAGYEGVYDGEGHGLAVDVSAIGDVSVRYSLSEEGPFVDSLLLTNVCDQTVWVELSALNYNSFTGFAQVVISPKSIESCRIDVESPVAYDGHAMQAAISVVDEDLGAELEYGVDYELEYSDNEVVGTAGVKVVGIGNYKDEVERTFEVVKGTVLINDESTWQWIGADGFAFDGTNKTVAFASDGAVPNEVVDVEITGVTNAVHAGTYTAYANGTMTGFKTDDFYNYYYTTVLDDVSCTWQIQPRSCDNCDASLSPGVMFHTGGGLEPEITVVDRTLGVVLEEGVDYSLEYEDNVTIGIAQVHILFNGDYSGSETLTFRIVDVVENLPKVKITPASGICGERVGVTLNYDGVEGVDKCVRYTLDGSEPTGECPVYSGRFQMELAGGVWIKAAAFVEGLRISEISASHIYPTIASVVLGEGSDGIMFSNDEERPWSMDDVVLDPYGKSTMRSCEDVANNTKSGLSATVRGKGTLSFKWKTSCEVDSWGSHFFDHAAFVADGVEVEWLDGVTDWVSASLKFKSAGDHVVQWKYVKDDGDDDDYPGQDCVWLADVIWEPTTDPAIVIEGDDGATIEGDSENGYTIKPSDSKKDVVVTIPDGVEAGKVTVEVSADVETVRANGANVKVMNKGHDIAAFLDLAAVTSSDGVINLAEAKVKDEVAKEALDTEKGAEIKLSPTDPSITTADTRPGLKYTFVEGQTIEELAPTEQYKWGDNTPFKPTPSIKGGTSAFYTIKVEK